MLKKYEENIPKMLNLELVLFEEKVSMLFKDMNSDLEFKKLNSKNINMEEVYKLKQLGIIVEMAEKEMRKRALDQINEKCSIEFSDYLKEGK